MLLNRSTTKEHTMWTRTALFACLIGAAAFGCRGKRANDRDTNSTTAPKAVEPSGTSDTTRGGVNTMPDDRGTTTPGAGGTYQGGAGGTEQGPGATDQNAYPSGGGTGNATDTGGTGTTGTSGTSGTGSPSGQGGMSGPSGTSGTSGTSGSTGTGTTNPTDTTNPSMGGGSNGNGTTPPSGNP
jgi:hypothetical protein